MPRITKRHLSAALVILLVVVLPVFLLGFLGMRLGGVPAAKSAIVTLQAASGEWWAVPLFVALYVIFTLLLLPVTPLSAVAAVMWGWKAAGALELVTCTMAAIPPYYIGRRGLWSWVQRRVSLVQLPALDSPFILLLLRIVPVIPFVALNYLAGATRVRMREYVLTAFFGSIPSVFLFVYFVDTMAAGAMGLATQAKIFGACLLVAAVAVILRLIAGRVAPRVRS